MEALAGGDAEVTATGDSFEVRTSDSDGFVKDLVESGLQFEGLRVNGWSLEAYSAGVWSHFQETIL